MLYIVKQAIQFVVNYFVIKLNVLKINLIVKSNNKIMISY